MSSFFINKNKVMFLEGQPVPTATVIKENPGGGINSLLIKPTKDLISEIAQTSPTADWMTYIPDKQFGVTVDLPHGNIITGTLNVRENSQREMYIDIFQVNDALQGQGIGTRLLKSLTAEAKYYGATTLNGHVTSESALRTRAKVFGKENLSFYNHRTGEKLGLTYEQVYKENPDVNVVVDLNKVDTSTWEKPVEKKQIQAEDSKSIESISEDISLESLPGGKI